MKRINKLILNAEYRSYLEQTAALEKDRIYCRHDMAHFLDVARIACILNLEENRGACKEMIYAAGLTHDIGRFTEYTTGEPHEYSSARLAGELLRECGFGEDEVLCVSDAIRAHRDPASVNAPGLKGLLYRADKLSRNCVCCNAAETCNKRGKNTGISY